MNNDIRTHFTNDWIKFVHAEPYSPAYDDNSWVLSVDLWIAHHKPSLAWELILKIVETDSSTKILAYLGGSMLETFLERWSVEYIDKVEAVARVSEPFRVALWYVDTDEMPPEIQARISAAIVDPIDDGNEEQ